MKTSKVLAGQVFGKLTVLERKWCEKSQRNLWYCSCQCGNYISVLTSSLLSGRTKSCGCQRKETTAMRSKAHGLSNSRTYRIWNAMKERCSCPSNGQFKDYGGRGITVCDEWMNSFQAFVDWAYANGYADNLTIDRIDNNGNYCPDNCRWITSKEQNLNKRTNRMITYNDKTQTLKQWSEETGIGMSTLHFRLNNGWSVELALTTQPKLGRKIIDKKS